MFCWTSDTDTNDWSKPNNNSTDNIALGAFLLWINPLEACHSMPVALSARCQAACWCRVGHVGADSGNGHSCLLSHCGIAGIVIEKMTGGHRACFAIRVLCVMSCGRDASNQFYTSNPCDKTCSVIAVQVMIALQFGDWRQQWGVVSRFASWNRLITIVCNGVVTWRDDLLISNVQMPMLTVAGREPSGASSLAVF